ncbi:amino acid permease [Aurantivibrio plasticivorans]
MMEQQPDKLSRSLSLPLITLYGIGTILGAGIYVLAGEVARESGVYTPHAFLLAGIIVSFSAYAYAKLSKRFPQSAGEAAYIHEALKSPALAKVVGWAIMLTGIVSAATITRGFTGYIALYLPLHHSLNAVLFVSILTGLAIWGVKQAVGLAALFTLVELIGIGLIVYFAWPLLPSIATNYPMAISLPPPSALSAIALGAFIAFYAFIGFEDMVNMAEEVKNPRRNLPISIYLALILTTGLYILTAFSFLALLPIEELANSEAPFADVARNHPGLSIGLITMISIAAISNGALVQIVMGSRVLYGMANRRLAPRIFGSINPTTLTPIPATLVVGLLVIVFATVLPLDILAKITSAIVLSIFSLVNLALLILEIKAVKSLQPLTLAKLFIPFIGMLLCVSFLTLQFYEWFFRH